MEEAERDKENIPSIQLWTATTAPPTPAESESDIAVPVLLYAPQTMQGHSISGPEDEVMGARIQGQAGWQIAQVTDAYIYTFPAAAWRHNGSTS